MATKRKQKRKHQVENLSRPNKWRAQHDTITGLQRGTDPETGGTVSHRRVVDLLTTMLDAGRITPEMRDAGEAFHGDFRRAALDGMPAPNLLRSGGGGGGLVMTERVVGARQRVADALEALGGTASPAGSCLWHVVGCESSIREWAARQGWAGRTMGHTQAQGVLVAALGTLAAWRSRPRGAARGAH